MPYLTEELWEHLGDGSSELLIGAAWPSFAPNLLDPEAEADIDWVIGLVGGVRAVRTEMNVPPGAKIPLLLKDASEAARRRAEAQKDIVMRLARLDSVDFVDGAAPEGAVPIVLDEATALLPLGSVIDIAQERARLERELEKTEADIANLDKRLGNEQFLAKAPPEVVAELRDRRATFEAKRVKIAAALAQLSGAAAE
jgi:valyl-tRNA synthetase